MGFLWTFLAFCVPLWSSWVFFRLLCGVLLSFGVLVSSGFFIGIFFGFFGVLWTSLALLSFLSTFLACFAVLWTSLEFFGLPWSSVDFCGVLWSSVDFPGVLLLSLKFCGLHLGSFELCGLWSSL